MGNRTKPLLERLQTCLKLSGYKRTLAVCMYGLGYGSQDVADETGLTFEECQQLRNGHQRTIKAITRQPEATVAYLVRVQRDRAVLKGFALSHSPDLDSRNLGNVARAAVTLSKDLAKSAPPTQAPKKDEPKPAPTRPQ